MQDELTSQDQPGPKPILLLQQGEAAGNAEQQAIPLGRLMSIVRRHLWVIVLTVVIAVGGTAAIVLRIPKQYSAEALILIEPQRTQVSDLQAISPDAGGDSSSLVRTQIDILRSPALASGMVETLHLTRYAEFSPPSKGQLVKAKEFLHELMFGPSGAHEPTPEEAVQAAASVLSSKISFSNEQHSSVLRIAATTQDPELSANIANQSAKLFLNFKRQEKFDAMQRAHDWFQEQMGPLADQLRDADLAVERYRQENGLDEQSSDEASASRLPSISRRQLDATSLQLVEVSRERSRKESQYAQAQAMIRGDASVLPEVLASPLITQLMGQAAAVGGREAQLASGQGNKNPLLASTHAQLQELHARINRETASIARSLNIDAEVSRAQEQALRKQMGELRVAVSAENAAQVGLQALQTKARATRSLYQSFLTRATQLANVAGIQEPDASLVSSARPPLGPSGPQTIRLIAVAFAVSLVLGIVLACLIERLRRGFSLPEHLEITLGMTLITLVPSVNRATLRGKNRRKNDRMALAYKTSFDKLRFQMRALGAAQPKIVMVTSSLPKEGKSVFSAGLARNAAAAGWRVLLIDCDIASPAIANQFGLPSGPGLCDILLGNIAVHADATTNDRSSDAAAFTKSAAGLHEPEPRLHVITAGHMPGDAQELLASNRMHALLAMFRERFDLILLDTPPMLPVADALVLARLADATFLLVRWEKTARAAAQEAVRLLHQSRARVMGAVMTRIDLRTAAGSAGRMSYSFSGYNTRYGDRPRPIPRQIEAVQPGLNT